MKWPVLQSFDQQHLERIALPVGGIGTGTVSLGGRGDLRDWEIANRPAKGFIPQGQGIYPFLAVYAKEQTGRKHARLLEGPVALTEYEGGFGSTAKNHGFPRFRHCEFKAAYPFGQVLLSDPDMPVKAVLKAFNPLIPGDAAGSSYPAAIFQVELQNISAGALETSVCLSVPNFIGDDGSQPERPDIGVTREKSGKANKNQFRREHGLTGIHMTAPALAKDSEQLGDMYIATPAAEVTYRTSWAELSWGDTKLDFWDDFTGDGRLDDKTSGDDKPVGSLCVSVALAPRETKEVTFYLTWRFPNRLTWSRCDKDESPIIGNHYATCFKTSIEVAEKLHASLERLEKKTVDFVNAVCSSSLPATVLEAALFNVSTLRSQTCFRTPDGKLYGWEGCFDRKGCCPGNCNHVWNYEHTTAFLFQELSATMRELEFQYATNERGHMVFRIDLPLNRKSKESICRNVAAADGQMGCIMKLYRDWQLSGNDKLLRDLYPHAKRSLEFCWVKGGWDADKDGLMEGCQHNTMDVEYYGPNPQMGFWYLGALRSMEEMAKHVGDHAFAKQCRDIFESGSKAIDARLFNGEYYEHIIEPPLQLERITEGLRLDMGSADMLNPELQLGSGCLVDQLVGQYTAHVLGLGYLSDDAKHRQTLASVYKYNFKKGFHDHFNHFRSFVLGDESGVLMATYPRGRRPARPFPYFNEVMTGFEYIFAVHMLYEGMVEQGIEVIRAIRERFDGKKRNPFNEAECGHHYARAMAAWSAIIALTGFRYSGVSKRMEFKAGNGTFFWSNGDAWGTCQIANGKVALSVQHGVLELKSFQLVGVGVKEWDSVQRIEETGSVSFGVRA